MTNYVALDKEAHRSVRINTTRSAELGDNVSAAPIVPREASRLIAEYPIVATKDPETGQFRLSALFGLAAGENLFLEDGEWRARYVPISIRRQPFMVGARAGSDQDNPDLVITLNTDSPRVSQADGEELFTAEGEPTEFLQTMNDLLSELVAGEQQSRAFLDTLLEYNLLEALRIGFEQPNKEKVTVEGLYSISADRLQDLEADVLSRLHAQGYLELIFMMKASLAHIGGLIDKRNQQQSS